MKIKRLCVFCGSSVGNSPIYEKEAREFALAMVKNELELVYGGGGIGLMGIIANTIKNNNLKVTGIIPTKIYEMVKEIESYEDELIIVDNMHQRKATMYENSDAFVALPGGIGTLEELLEIFTWFQLGYHNKAVGLLDINGYYSNLIRFFDDMHQEGFVKKEALSSLIIESDPHVLIEKLKSPVVKLEAKFKENKS